MSFVPNKNSTIDDIIEHILVCLNSENYAGGCLQVPEFCFRSNYDYDRIMEPAVREKMYQYKVAKRCTGNGQPETAIMLTPFGAQVYREGGWKKYLAKLETSERERKLAENEQKITQERIKDEELNIGRQNVQAARSSSRAAWFAGVIAALALLITLIQFSESRTQNSEINGLKQELIRLDSLMKVQQQVQRQTYILMDSLSTHKNRK